MEENLKIYRNQIDEIDGKIQELFLKRMEIAAKIANYNSIEYEGKKIHRRNRGINGRNPL